MLANVLCAGDLVHYVLFYVVLVLVRCELMCLVQMTSVLCFFLFISNIMYDSFSIKVLERPGFSSQQGEEYFFLLLQQFLVSSDFHPFMALG